MQDRLIIKIIVLETDLENALQVNSGPISGVIYDKKFGETVSYTQQRFLGNCETCYL